jgi:enoyl-CoA hydratase/carnithine racemase
MTRLSPRWITDCGSSHDLFNHSVNWKPVIAASHGYVMELAVGIVLECDLVVAEEGTQFQITETSRGLGAAKCYSSARRSNFI